ncbi:MAG: 8-amino-7-oxononanoate synthase [Succinivibrio sp.]|nr:8-amino-7-oxononanoate synthase [Succinivibrio sp.]
MELYARFQEELSELEAGHKLRSIKAKAQQDSQIEIGGQTLLNLSANDYLGLGHDQLMVSRFLAELPSDSRYFSSSGSLLLTGAFPSFERATQSIERAYGRSALLFNSGFAANSSVLAALGDKETLILADKLAHASILQGLALSKAKSLRFAHNSLEHLETLLRKYASAYDNVLLVTEAVFSMDGDLAPLRQLAALKRQYPNLYLYVDEAHSFGVFGPQGLGLCVQEGVLKDADFVLCTLGKACGSCGAFLLTNELTRSYLINKAQALIFSTALPPIQYEQIRFMFEVLRGADERRQTLHSLSGQARQLLSEQGFLSESQSQILPLLTYSEDEALRAAAFFVEQGFLTLPIRHPTVPAGKARLRLSLSASLPEDFMERFARSVKLYTQSRHSQL